ncbi:MAG: hypothetical protein K2M46_08125 [Lachnospiraceae bacterium]|nr:hypothetical protein [Lachnospiraceae bacterium]
MLFDTEEALSDGLLTGKAYKQLGMGVPQLCRDGATFPRGMENQKGSAKAGGFHTRLVSVAIAPIN